MKDNIVEIRHISKTFPGAKVLDDINFEIKRGEVHALLGENGAGKSTLLNILHGIYDDYEGEIVLDGKSVHFKNPNDAIINGKISKVHQETNAIKDLTVGQNVTLGYEPVKGLFVDYKKLNKRVNEILDELKCGFRSETRVMDLTAGEMQMMAITKALFHNSIVISLDEPTASLTTRETETLFKVIEKLKSQGITVIYVSHRLEEVFRICDRATILRDGHYITTLDIADTTKEELIKNMVGREVSSVASRLKPSCVKDEVVLKVENFNSHGKFKDINFELHKGEILGFSGLVGSGRTEVMRAIFGADKKDSGTLYLHGKQINIKNSNDALKNGIGLLPEDRKTQGFMTLSTNIDNVAVSSLEKYMKGFFVDNGKKLDNCNHFIKELDVHPPRADYLTKNMSGGNQQKIIIARWLSTNADIIIFDEPTKGVDVAAKAEIYRLMEEMVAEGKSLIVVSSELPEVMGISDRIIVMCEGCQKAELKREEFEEKTILTYAIGGDKNE